MRRRYAVLAYIAQVTVHHYCWLSAGQMIDALGIAETTPGPLIRVVRFVGFLTAYGNQEHLRPLAAVTLAVVVVTWVTYPPFLLWTFLGRRAAA